MIGGRQQQARFQSDFYRNNYYRILTALIYSCIFILLLIAIIIYLILFRTEPNYYATTTYGQIIPLQPMTAE